jgi:hypothetical protein
VFDIERLDYEVRRTRRGLLLVRGLIRPGFAATAETAAGEK